MKYTHFVSAAGFVCNENNEILLIKFSKFKESLVRMFISSYKFNFNSDISEISSLKTTIFTKFVA